MLNLYCYGGCRLFQSWRPTCLYCVLPSRDATASLGFSSTQLAFSRWGESTLVLLLDHWDLLHRSRTHPCSHWLTKVLQGGRSVSKTLDPLRSSAWGRLTTLSPVCELLWWGGVTKVPTSLLKYCRWWKGLLVVTWASEVFPGVRQG